MGWMTDRLADNHQSQPQSSPEDRSFESSAETVWSQMMAGFQRDVEEFNAGKGDADLKELSAHEGRISNEAMKIAVVVIADLPAHTIRYRYEPGDETTAVPEQGVLTMRQSASGIELYSADQHLNSEAARRLILEPLFFANPPLEATGT
jgi:hypothetical protein